LYCRQRANSEKKLYPFVLYRLKTQFQLLGKFFRLNKE
jgi:hypothetical protein